MREYPLFGYANPSQLYSELIRLGAKVCLNTVYGWKTGRIVPSMSMIVRVSHALELNSEEQNYFLGAVFESEAIRMGLLGDLCQY